MLFGIKPSGSLSIGIRIIGLHTLGGNPDPQLLSPSKTCPSWVFTIHPHPEAAPQKR
jgi:hypothetical protein